MLVCYICKGNFCKIKSLCAHMRYHLATHSARSPLKCGQRPCSSYLNDIKTYRQHLRSQHINLEEADAVVQNLSCSAAVPHSLSEETDSADIGVTVNVDIERAEIADNMDVCSSSTVSSELYRLNQIAACGIAEMRSQSGAPASATLKSVELANDVCESMVDLLKVNVTNYFKDSAQKVEYQLLLSSFDKYSRPLEFLDSTSKQLKYFKKNMGFVEPKTIQLDIRNEIDKNGTMRKVNVTWQYIPLLETLKSVLNVPEIFALLENGQPSSNIDVIDNFCCGRIFESHPLFNDKSRVSVALELYYDDIETTNPLGSKTVIHKMGVFYFTIKNLPTYYTANMANIHLLGIVHADDLKLLHGFDAILGRFMHDIRCLEDNGISVHFGDKETKIYGSLALVTGDNLGKHAMFGYAQSFSANYFCEHCMTHKKDLNKIQHESQCKLRTRELYEDHEKVCRLFTVVCKNSAAFQMFESMPCDQVLALTGMKSTCVLNRLQFWHVTLNKTGDLMHDFLEGVGPYEVKLILRDLVTSCPAITLPLINQRINNFPYGASDMKNKPSEIPNLRLEEGKDLKQKAMQFWALFRLLPIMLGDLVPNGHPIWEFYLELRHIADILFAHKWTRANLGHFTELLEIHLKRFRYLFPAANIIPKHHFLLHYSTHCENSGPPYHNMVISEEMKGNFFKRCAHVMCNFKNVPFSLAMRHQYFAMHSINSCRIKRKKVMLQTCTILPAERLPCSASICEILNVSPCESISISKRMTVYGQNYCTGMILAITKQDEMTIFGRIFGCFTDNTDNPYFIVSMMDTIRFDRHYWAYVCTNTGQSRVVQHSDLLDYHPLDAYNLLNDNSLDFYITQRYQLF